MLIRTMTIEDYDGVYALWMTIKGFGIRSIDDSREGVERFLKRNPTTSVVGEADGKIVGSIDVYKRQIMYRPLYLSIRWIRRVPTRMQFCLN